MLKDFQQQELHNLTSKYKPLYLWSELASLFLQTASPATSSFILDSFNRPDLHEKVSAITGLPLYKTNQNILVYVLDHIYVNMPAQKELFFGSSPVTYEVTSEKSRPAMYLKYTPGNFFTVFPIGLKQFFWVLNFSFSGKAIEYCEQIKQKVDFYTTEIPKINDLRAMGDKIDEAMMYVVSSILISGLLEQYLNFFIIQKYQYSWDDIEAYYLDKFCEDNLYLQSQEELEKVAQGTETLQEYLTKYGNLGFIDYELSSPRLSEDTNKMRNKIMEMKNTISPKKKSEIPHFSQFERGLIETYWRIQAVRGTVRVKSMVIISHLRKLLLLHAQAHSVPPSLIFFMRKDEVLNKPEAFIKEAENRNIRYMQNAQIDLPPLLTEEIVTNLLLPYQKGGRYDVIPISPGVVTAKIHCVKDNKPFECEKGCILYLPDGSPQYTPFYSKGAGIIFAKGGSISHGAILARESKIPTVSLGGQDFHLEDDMLVSIDGENGILEIK